MPKYRTLLFDADQTLLDFHRSEHEAVTDCLEAFGVPVNNETIAKYSEINTSYWKMLERGEIEKSKLYSARWATFAEFYGYDIDAQAISDLYIDKLSERAYVLDGAEEMVEKLSKTCRIYIITNGNKKVQDGRMGKLSISRLFLDRFISEEIGFEKPSVEYFDIVKSKIPNFDPETTLVIGDSLTSDIQGGINAGLDTCWYNPQKKSAPEGMSITYIVSSFSEIEDIIL